MFDLPAATVQKCSVHSRSKLFLLDCSSEIHKHVGGLLVNMT